MRNFLIAVLFGIIAFAGNVLIKSLYFKPIKKDVSALEVIFKDSNFYEYAKYMESKGYILHLKMRNTGSNFYLADINIQNFCKDNNERNKKVREISPNSPSGKKAKSTILEQTEEIQKICFNVDENTSESIFYPSIKEPMIKQVDTLEFLREMSYTKKFKFN